MKKRFLSLLICLAMTVPAFASIGVAPTRVELNANKARGNYITTAVEVKGDPQKPMRFRVYAEYFKVNEKAEVVLLGKTEEPNDMSKKIRFVPSEFTVPAGKAQKLRINIANIKSLPDGESRAVLFVEDVNAKEYSIPLNGGIGAQLIVKTRVGVPVYVDKGKFTKIGEIEHFNVTQNKNQLALDMKVLSKGNSRIRCNGKIQLAQGKKLVKEFTLPEKVVANGNFYNYKENFDLKDVPSGEYTVKMNLTYLDNEKRKKNLKQETTLNIKGEM